MKSMRKRAQREAQATAIWYSVFVCNSFLKHKEFGPRPSPCPSSFGRINAWGVEAALRKLVGMFAFALWDRTARTLTLARDRIGKKPLFWGRFGELFLFASELKGLRAHPSWTPEIDRESLAAYMRWGYVPSPYCIHCGIPQAVARPVSGGPARSTTPRRKLLGSN